MEDNDSDTAALLIALTSDIVAAHVSNNVVDVADVSGLITSVHGALAGLGGDVPIKEQRKPAVSIRASLKRDHLVCLEDGKKFKTLKRHLMNEHGMTPDEYRGRWGLGADYPMVAPDYAQSRSALAKSLGLSRKAGQKRGKRRKPA